MYMAEETGFVTKVQPLTTTSDGKTFLQYSTIVDLVVHESMSCIPGVPYTLDYVHTGSNVEIKMPYYGKPLQDVVPSIPEDEKESFALHVLSSLVTTCLHLQQNGLQHTDMKPSNILVNAMRQVTLIDFNIMSTIHVYDDQIRWSESIGTWHYCAPEIIRTFETHETSLVWTLGILLAYMIHRFPIERRYRMTKKQLASRRHWKQVYEELQKENEKHLPLPIEHQSKMNIQLQYIFEKCVQWNPNKRLTLFELHTMVSLYRNNGQLPRPLALQTVSWCADPTYMPREIRQEAVQKIYILCDHLNKLDLFVRIVSWMDRLMLKDISNEELVACFCLAWMLQGEYVLNDQVLFEKLHHTICFDDRYLNDTMLYIGQTLCWRLWEKSFDVYFVEFKRKDVITHAYHILMSIEEPYTMQGLATRI